MAVGAGCEVVRWYMMFVLGQFAQNGFCSMDGVLIVRKFCMMGLQHPCGSIAKFGGKKVCHGIGAECFEV